MLAIDDDQGDDAFMVGEALVRRKRNLIEINGEQTLLEPKVMDVLFVLAQRSGDVMSRDEIITAVWDEGGGDERLTRAISILRRVFGDNRHAARYIETVAKRGYRLAAKVGPVCETSPATPSKEASRAPQVALAIFVTAIVVIAAYFALSH